MVKPISAVPTRARQFRILALPLARIPRPSTAPPADASSSGITKPTPLVLYHVSQPDATAESGPPSLSKRALNKASDVWVKLGEKDKKSVSYWFYKKGEGLMDKIEYEEWALKNVQEGRGVKILQKGEQGTQEKIEVSCSRHSVVVWVRR
jgi:SH3-like domain-containing protein